MNFSLNKTSDPHVLAGQFEKANKSMATLTVHKAEPLEQSKTLVGIEGRGDIEMTVDQLDRMLRRRETGEHIQNILPLVEPRDREYFITGTPLP